MPERYSPDSPILGTGTLTPKLVMMAQGLGHIEPEHRKPIIAYLEELHRLCRETGINFDIAAAQWGLETDWGRSERWRVNRNPAGLGIEHDGDPDPATFTGVEAARVHFWALWAIVDDAGGILVRELPESAIGFMDRWNAKLSDASYPWPVVTIADLQKRYFDAANEPQAVWAWDERYAEKICERANALLDAARKGAPMAITAEPCPIETYVQWSGPNRPGLAMHSPSKIVIHEVGNTDPTADEDMHRRFVLGGGGANQVSFHFVVGPTKIVQLLYLDENAWHASDGYWGDGNRDGWGIEHIQIGDFNKTLAHGAWLCSELARNPRRFAITNPSVFVQDINPENVDERMVQHNWEAPYGKNCPQFIRTRGLWEPYVQAVREAVRKPSGPVDPQPSPIWWEPGDQWGPQKRSHDGAIAWAFLGEVTAKRNVPIRKDAHAKAPVVHRLKAGDTAQIVGTHKAANKTVWAFIEYAPGKVGRSLLSAFEPYRWPTV